MIPPLALPGLQSLGSLAAPSNAVATGGTAGGGFMQGDWNVNLGGSGFAMQGGPHPLILAAIAAGAVWLLMRRR